MRRPLLQGTARLAGTLCAAAAGLAHAGAANGDCLQAGLAPATHAVVELRELNEPPRTASAWRSADGTAWFVPLAKTPGDGSLAAAPRCDHEGASLWKIPGGSAALAWDASSGVLTIDDTSRTTVFDARKRLVESAEPRISTLGLNYQVAANYSERQFSFNGLAEAYGWHGGWYYTTGVGLSKGSSVRYESYALRENLDSAVFLRLGDSITAPNSVGESLRFAGLAWGTDRNLQPGDFAPSLPDVRGSNVISGPVDLYINDSLQYQQQLQNGVYDLRNVPAQQGFNSYRVRTLDAQGNPVYVVRDIYVPATLLPPGAKTWRVDAGWERRNFASESFNYGPPLVAGNFAWGLDYDTTVSASAHASKRVSIASVAGERRLGSLWAVHAGVHTAHSEEYGSANGVTARIEGGGRLWRLYLHKLRSAQGLPSLGVFRPPLRDQWLLRAQWTGIPGVSMGLTFARNQRLGESTEEAATLYASINPWSSNALLMVALTRLRTALARQTQVSLSLFMPLGSRDPTRTRSIFATAVTGDDARVARIQYNDSDASTGDQPSWTLGADHDLRSGRSSADGLWTARTREVEVLASARATQGHSEAMATLRSGLVFAQGARFVTRPVTGAFAVVSTGQEGITVFHDNRPTAVTNAQGVALIPSLRALEANRISLDPAQWPIQMNASEVDRVTVPPRGGGVLVSFIVSAQAWPADTMVVVARPDGQKYPAGTVVVADDGSDRRTVVNREGQVWVGDLLPAPGFRILFQGQSCAYKIPPLERETPVAPLQGCKAAP